MRELDAVVENRLLSRWAVLLPRAPGQVGAVHETDSELLPLGDGRLLALKVDAVVEEVRAGLYDPFLAGRTAVISALADLAAVGADPVGVLLAVTLPGDAPRMQAEVARGAREACEAAGTWVLGGDTNDGPDLTVTCVAAGLVPEYGVLTRVGAAPGDTLWASGPLGQGAALAAHRLLGTPAALFGPDDFRPAPTLALGRALRGLASCAMDTSDGLVATLDQLSRLNRVRLVVDGPAERLLAPRVAALRATLGVPALAMLAGQHGEFALVFTTPPGVAPVPGALRLGRVEAGAGVRIAGADIDGARLRNLLQQVGDPRRYALALVALTGGPGGAQWDGPAPLPDVRRSP